MFSMSFMVNSLTPFERRLTNNWPCPAYWFS